VNPPLLGMTRTVSEDAVRRGLDKIEEEAGETWVQGHLDYTTRPLLSEPWILDIDTTVKPLCRANGGSGGGRCSKLIRFQLFGPSAVRSDCRRTMRPHTVPMTATPVVKVSTTDRKRLGSIAAPFIVEVTSAACDS